MAAVIAPHNAIIRSGYLADRSGNDPFVWSQPFVWSHCHARSRPSDFGFARRGPLVCNKDAVFFVAVDPVTEQLVCDCVFVIDKVIPIGLAEAAYPSSHPIRHYHFDQSRSPYHTKSTLTRIADPDKSFVPHPPAPVEPWIEAHLRRRKLPAVDYFRMKKRRNVRVVVTDAQGIYDRIETWCSMPGHHRLHILPLPSLKELPPDCPAEGDIVW